MKIIKKLIIIIIILLLIALSIFIGIGYNRYIKLLHDSPIISKISQLQEDVNYTKLDHLPKDYLNAVVDVEDRRFYKHGAIDLISIGRAVFTNIKKGELVEGGSTLTQQLAKNLYFDFKADPLRKVSELFMAYTLEDNYTKDEILELYVNTCYFGSGYTGIKEASLGYFNKEPKDMTLDECTLIAGIPNAPSIYGLNNRPDLARKRQQHVINSMVTNKHLSKEDANNLLETINKNSK